MKNQFKTLTKLEAVRGFAAAYVVLHHTFSKGLVIGGKDISFLFRFGQEAVILFFVLSGFVIQYAYIRSKDNSFKTFFLKRFLRIYIPLLIVFAANYLLSIGKAGLHSIEWPTLFGNIFMLQDTSLKPNTICGPFMGNSPLWSLSYEWWFYMLFYFLRKYFKDKASAVVYIAGTISALTYLVYPNFINRELMYLIIWWVGADMATLYVKKQEITIGSLKRPLTVLIINILILILNVKLNNKNSTIGISPFLELRHFFFALLAVLLALIWKRFKWAGYKNTLGLFEPIASISFGIYISHWFLIVHAHYLDKLINSFYIRFLIYTLVCILFSYVVECVIYVRLSTYLLKKLLIVKAPAGPSLEFKRLDDEKTLAKAFVISNTNKRKYFK